MVSRFVVIFFAAVTVWAQTPISPLAVRQEDMFLPEYANRIPQLTPEMRGDIQMARKMFREAVEIVFGRRQNPPSSRTRSASRITR